MRSIRIWFKKVDSAKYISHLDLTRCVTRIFRRTDIPLWYTEGFNPHPYLMFSLPLPLGAEGLRETLDIRINDDGYTDIRVLEQLNNATVPGIEFLEIKEPAEKITAIVSASYTVTIPNVAESEKFAGLLKSIVNEKNIIIDKKTKKGGIKQINVSEHLSDFHCVFNGDSVILSFILPAGNDFTINPVAFCKKLFEIANRPDILHRVVRNKLLMKDRTEFK